jgi:hypothetical protein
MVFGMAPRWDSMRYCPLKLSKHHELSLVSFAFLSFHSSLELSLVSFAFFFLPHGKGNREFGCRARAANLLVCFLDLFIIYHLHGLVWV